MKERERITEFSEHLSQDYDFSYAVGIRKRASLTVTFLLFLLLMLETFIGLATTTIPILLTFLIINIFLVVLMFRSFSTYLLSHFQVIIVYAAIETHVIYNPTYFHTMVYWMPIIPMLSIILSSLRASYVWLGITLNTILINAIYGSRTIGESYQVEPNFIAFGVGGVVFVVGFYLAYAYLYNLIGNYYLRLQSKNDEINHLNDELNDLNENLENKVLEKVSDIKKQNERLEKFAFMNAHVVRAPLANIIGAVRMYNESDDEGSKREFIEMISKSANSLDEAIREVASELTTDNQ